MFDFETIIVIVGAFFVVGIVIAQAMENAKKDKIIMMKDDIIAGKNVYILRLYAELKKEKGIDKPFIVPLDYIPDFDIEAVFKAAEEEAKEEAEEEAEEGGAA